MEARYRPEQTLSSILSDDRLFSELGNEYDEKQIQRLLHNNGEIFVLFLNIKKREIFH